MQKKQLNDTINNLKESLEAEKTTRDNWIEKFEHEQQAHTNTSTQLIQARSDLKDQVMETKNIEIQHQMAERQLETTNAQVKKFQTSINEAVARKENLERELATQKEIMTQFEHSKRDYIDKLKHELETVDERFEQVNNRTKMEAEDARSFALRNFARIKQDEVWIQELKFKNGNLEGELK